MFKDKSVIMPLAMVGLVALVAVIVVISSSTVQQEVSEKQSVTGYAKAQLRDALHENEVTYGGLLNMLKNRCDIYEVRLDEMTSCSLACQGFGNKICISADYVSKNNLMLPQPCNYIMKKDYSRVYCTCCSPAEETD